MEVHRMSRTTNLHKTNWFVVCEVYSVVEHPPTSLPHPRKLEMPNSQWVSPVLPFKFDKSWVYPQSSCREDIWENHSHRFRYWPLANWRHQTCGIPPCNAPLPALQICRDRWPKIPVRVECVNPQSRNPLAGPLYLALAEEWNGSRPWASPGIVYSNFQFLPSLPLTVNFLSA